MKKMPWDIIILHKCSKNYDHMLHCSWDMARDRCNCCFSFLAIFCPFTPLNRPKNQNFWKMKKTPEDIIILHMSSKNYDQMMNSSWDMVQDGRTDRQKKWHIEAGAPPKKAKIRFTQKFKQIIMADYHN